MIYFKKLLIHFLTIIIFASCSINSTNNLCHDINFIGEKTPEDEKAVGDIVFKDGSATPYSNTLSLTDEQKSAAIAIIFYVGTECSNDNSIKTLGVGLAHNQSGISWCTKDSSAYNENIISIQSSVSYNKILVFCTDERIQEALDAGADYAGNEEYIEKVKGGWLDFDLAIATPDIMKNVGQLGMVLGRKGLMPNPKTGTVSNDIAAAIDKFKNVPEVDKDGSENLEQISVFLTKNSLQDDTATADKYSAFYFAKNYINQNGSNIRKSNYETGWNLPSYTELYYIYMNKNIIESASSLCDGDKFESKCYWSSSQYYFDNSNALSLNFNNGSMQSHKKDNTTYTSSDDIICACAIHSF